MSSSRPNKHQQHEKEFQQIVRIEAEGKRIRRKKKKKQNLEASKWMNEWMSEQARVSNLIAFVWVQNSSWVASSFGATACRYYMLHTHTHYLSWSLSSPLCERLCLFRNTFYNSALALFYCGLAVFFSLSSSFYRNHSLSHFRSFFCSLVCDICLFVVFFSVFIFNSYPHNYARNKKHKETKRVSFFAY